MGGRRRRAPYVRRDMVLEEEARPMIAYAGRPLADPLKTPADFDRRFLLLCG